MTTEAAYPEGDPHRLLSGTRELARRVRRAQRATWFPLLVFAALTFAAIPVRRYGGHHRICVTVLGGPQGTRGGVCTIYSNAQFVYWPMALVLAYLAIAAFYIRRSRPWYSLPLVFQGGVLLLGGIGFALAQRPLRSPAP